MVLAELAYNDDIINVSELKKNWPQWGERARNKPVTILYKDDPLTLISRKYIGELTKKMYYTNLMVSFCQGYLEDKSGRRGTLPWAAYLKSADRRTLLRELMSAYEESYAKDDWMIVQNVVDDWKATAEVESNPRLAKALMADEDSSQYIEIKD